MSVVARYEAIGYNFSDIVEIDLYHVDDMVVGEMYDFPDVVFLCRKDKKVNMHATVCNVLLKLYGESTTVRYVGLYQDQE